MYEYEVCKCIATMKEKFTIICDLTICHRSQQICSIVGMILKFSFYIELYILQSVNFTNTTFATKV